MHAIIDAVKRKGETHRKLSANPEQLRWGRKRLIGVDGAKWKVAELRVSLMVGFIAHYESENWGNWKIVIFRLEKWTGPLVAAIIRWSKTDQQKLGARRTLAATS